MNCIELFPNYRMIDKTQSPVVRICLLVRCVKYLKTKYSISFWCMKRIRTTGSEQSNESAAYRYWETDPLIIKGIMASLQVEVGSTV